MESQFFTVEESDFFSELIDEVHLYSPSIAFIYKSKEKIDLIPDSEYDRAILPITNPVIPQQPIVPGPVKRRASRMK